MPFVVYKPRTPKPGEESHLAVQPPRARLRRILACCPTRDDSAARPQGAAETSPRPGPRHPGGVLVWPWPSCGHGRACTCMARARANIHHTRPISPRLGQRGHPAQDARRVGEDTSPPPLDRGPPARGIRRKPRALEPGRPFVRVTTDTSPIPRAHSVK